MYSPADRPSSTRAAPAKNRIWSTIGGISSDSGQRRSACRCSRPRRRRARRRAPRSRRRSAAARSCRSARRACRATPRTPPRRPGRRASTSAADDTGACGEHLAGARVDEVRRCARRRRRRARRRRSCASTAAVAHGRSPRGRVRAVGRAQRSRPATVLNSQRQPCDDRFRQRSRASTTDSLAKARVDAVRMRRHGEPRPTQRRVVLDDVVEGDHRAAPGGRRRPYAAIGKAVGLSEAAVRQRVQRLLERRHADRGGHRSAARSASRARR